MRRAVYIPANSSHLWRAGDKNIMTFKKTPVKTHKQYRYWYNGKEWQNDLDLNLYDYGARQYDPALGRWFTVDPLAEEYVEQTPYNYTLNNPVILIDPTGMAADSTFTLTANGEIKPKDDQVYYDENGNRMDKLVSEKTGEEMLIEEGVLSTRKTEKVKTSTSEGVKEVNVQYIETTGSEKDTQLFEFMVENSDREAAYVFFDTGQSFVFNNPDEDYTGEVTGTYKLLSLMKRSHLQIHIHSHPDNSGPSNADLKNLKRINNIHPQARFYIFNKPSGRYQPFNRKSVYQTLEPVIFNINK